MLGLRSSFLSRASLFMSSSWSILEANVYFHLYLQFWTLRQLRQYASRPMQLSPQELALEALFIE